METIKALPPFGSLENNGTCDEVADYHIHQDDHEVGGIPLKGISNTPLQATIPKRDETAAPKSGLSFLTMDIATFPPLPVPALETRRKESITGVSIVLFLSSVFIALTHGVALTAIGGIDRKGSVWWTFSILVYTEVGFALICLMGLLWTDPGIIHRSSETCHPIPAQIEPWIIAHSKGTPEVAEAPKEAYAASPDTNSKDTYCTRCLVWRRCEDNSNINYFHCRTCNRCVAHFDHHCTVFGRCIAGTMSKGNYSYFVTIITMFILGYLTTCLSLVWSLSKRYRPEIVVPVFLVFLWFVTACAFGRSGSGIWCRVIGATAVHLIQRCMALRMK